MKRFEYKIVTFDHICTCITYSEANLRTINQYGKQGWEMVNIVYDSDINKITIFFKREIIKADV